MPDTPEFVDSGPPPAPPSLPPPPLYSPNVANLQDDNVYVQIYTTMRQEAVNARRLLERQWDFNWALYMNQYDFSRKKPWQHRGYVAKVPEMVDDKHDELYKALVKTNGEYFKVVPAGRRMQDIMMARAFEKVLRVILNEIDFDDVIFPPQLVIAQLAYMALKIGIRRDEDGRLEHTIEAVSPWDFFPDPLNMGRYCIHRSYLDMSVFREMVKKPPYIPGIADKVKPGADDTMEMYAKQTRVDQQPSMTDFSQMVIVDEVHAKYVDKPNTGDRLHDDVVFAVANERTLIRRPQKNPMPLKRFPFAYGSTRRLPFSTYGKPPVSDIAGMAKTYSDMWNLTLDSTLWHCIPTFEANYYNFAHPEELHQGVVPGKVYFKRNPMDPNQLIRPVEMGSMKQELPFILSFFDRALGSHIAPSVETGKPSGGDVTATEIQIKSMRASSRNVQEARELEAQVMEPTLEQLLANEVRWRRRYRDDPRFLAVLSDEEISMLEGLTESERNNIIKQYTISVKGMSAMLDADEKADQVDAWLNRIGRVAKGSPEVMARINFEGIADLYAEATNLPVEKLLLTEDEAMAKMQRMQQMQLQGEQQAQSQQADIEQQQKMQDMQMQQGQRPPMALMQGGAGQ